MKKNIFINIAKYFFILLIVFSIWTNVSSAIDTNPTPGQGAVQDNQMKKGLNNADDMLNDVATNPNVGYSSSKSLEEMIGLVIKFILSFVGIIFLILIIISGLQWMTAGGNEEMISKSKNRIKNATYGLAIVLLAYGITMFVTTWLIVKSGFTN